MPATPWSSTIRRKYSSPAYASKTAHRCDDGPFYFFARRGGLVPEINLST
jgi:hypothetical protein